MPKHERSLTLSSMFTPRHSMPELYFFSGVGCSVWQLGFLAAGAFALIHKTLSSKILLGHYLKSPYLYSSLQMVLEIHFVF